MKQELPLQIGNETFLLLADKAIYWPAQKILLIADAHFGKAAAYRALGQPVPRGTSAANLQRLDILLAAYDCEQIIFLGDFLHAPKSHAPATLAAIDGWRKRHAHVRCLLIRGNHDTKAGDPPDYLDLAVVTEPYLIGPLALRHTPDMHPTHHVIAGHLHPVYRLHGKGRQNLRLPCFCHASAITVLPAFGDFTGGYNVEGADDERIFVTDGSCIWAIA